MGLALFEINKTHSDFTMKFCWIKVEWSGSLKVCNTSQLEPTQNTDTCIEFDNESWKFGDKTVASSAEGKSVVTPLLFTGEFIVFLLNSWGLAYLKIIYSLPCRTSHSQSRFFSPNSVVNFIEL